MRSNPQLIETRQQQPMRNIGRWENRKETQNMCGRIRGSMRNGCIHEEVYRVNRPGEHARAHKKERINENVSRRTNP